MTVPSDGPGGPDGTGAVLPLRRNRDFQLIWGGQAVSLLGSQTSKIAYPLLVLALTGSIAVAGLLAHITFAQILVAGFLEGAASVFFSLAQRAALPMLVHPSQRAMAIGQNEARQNAAQLAGPALGGALFGLSRAAPFAADALSYLASLVTLCWPGAKAPAPPRSASASGAWRRRPGRSVGRALVPAQDPGRPHHYQLPLDLGAAARAEPVARPDQQRDRADRLGRDPAGLAARRFPAAGAATALARQPPPRPRPASRPGR